MSFKRNLNLVALALAGLVCTVTATATNVSTRPLKADVLVKPNIVFGMDDSGSMDFETMLYASDGAFWWDYNASSGWGIDASHPDPDLRTTTNLWFNNVGNSSTQWRKMAYLFPNGSGLGERFLTDSSNDHFAIMPTAQFAFLRSSAYNGLYYNTAVTYAPWAPATLGSNTTETVFSNATAASAKSHPVNGTSTFNLPVNVPLSTAANTVFTALPGMTIPAGAQISTCNSSNGGAGCGTTWTTLTSDTAAATTGVTRVAMSYYAPTFWQKEACTSPAVCATAPDGSSLKRYEIKATTASYPSGRTYADELQNFANWFQFYRKRKLMLAGAMGEVLEGLSGTRLGVVAFNSRSDVTMYDADDTVKNKSRSRVAGIFYEVNRSGGTPTRETLKYIGDQYARTNTDSFGNKIIQYACQRNYAFVVTDGFANASNVSLPSYDSGKSETTWGSGAPYQTIYSGGTLADLALRYYTNNPRKDLTLGALTVTPRDKNVNLHMNTYGLSMGARGTIFRSDSTPVPTDVNAWPNPDQMRNPTSVDDLWHATINGRGKMYLATTPEETAQKVQAGLNDILDQTGTQSALSVSTINLRNTTSPTVYQGSYNPQGWAGDLKAYPINPGTGQVTTTTPNWSASDKLTARTTARIIVGAANASGSSVLDFTASNFGSRVNPSGAYGSNAAVIDYLRGNRSGEGTVFRARGSQMGAIITSRPVVDPVNKVIYVNSGDGMMHAFDTNTGDELWAYVPYAASADMGNQSVRGWNFSSKLDGSPVLSTVGGKKMLISGLGTAGAGYFAIDVTDPRSMTVSSFTGKVWEFKGTGMGLSMGKPVVVDTATWGSVVILTSGYNGTTDGVGRVYLLDATTGALLKTIGTTSYGTGDPGLARLSALLDADGKSTYAYAGDENGRLWRFNLNPGTATLITQFKNAANAVQPITAVPELAYVNGDRIVMVGTGRLMDLTDFSNASVQTFYAVKDNGVAMANARADTSMKARVLGAENADREAGVTGGAFDWSTDRGWYLDLPAGQQANTDPTVAFGAIAFTTNVASSSDCTSSSYLYLLDIKTGKAPEGTNFGSVWLNNALAADVVILSTDGTVSGVNLVGNISTSDNQILNKVLALNAGVTPRKNAWRQLLRP